MLLFYSRQIHRHGKTTIFRVQDVRCILKPYHLHLLAWLSRKQASKIHNTNSLQKKKQNKIIYHLRLWVTCAVLSISDTDVVASRTRWTINWMTHGTQNISVKPKTIWRCLCLPGTTLMRMSCVRCVVELPGSFDSIIEFRRYFDSGSTRAYTEKKNMTGLTLPIIVWIYFHFILY